MKNILTIIALFFIQILYCQNSELALSIEVIADEKIEGIEFSNFRRTIVYSFNENTELNFKNDFPEQYILIVRTKEKSYEDRFWLDEGEININIIIDSKSLKIDVEGSELFNNSMEFQNKFDALNSKKVDTLILNEFLFNELNKNIDNPFSYFIGVSILFKNQSDFRTLIKLRNTFDSQDDIIKEHYMSDLLFSTLKSKLSNKNINISNFKFLNSKDEEKVISFSDNDDYILIDFWTTSCPPCLKDHIRLKELIQKIREKKTKLISISSDKKNRIDTWKKYIIAKELPWVNYLEKENNSLTENLNIQIFPTYILLNKQNGIVIYSNSLDEVLAELKIEE